MISIRELQSDDDLTLVLELCREFFVEYEDHHEEFFDTENLTDDSLSGRFLESMKSDTSVSFVALDDERIVGYAACDIRKQPPFYRIRRIGVVWGLMVEREHRRKGIAARLLAAAKEWFARNDIEYFTAYTASSNRPAIEFYERIGMKVLHMTLIGKSTKEG